MISVNWGHSVSQTLTQLGALGVYHCPKSATHRSGHITANIRRDELLHQHLAVPVFLKAIEVQVTGDQLSR